MMRSGRNREETVALRRRGWKVTVATECSFQNVRRSPRCRETPCRAGLSLLLLILFAFTGTALAASDIFITASVDPAQIDVGDMFTYEVQITGSRASLPNPKVDFPESFRIVSGPNSSLNYQLINGRVSSSKTLTWMIIAEEAGTFTIPGPEVRIKRELKRGPKVEIRVGNNPGYHGNTGSPTRQNKAAVRQSTQINMKGEKTPPVFLRMEVEPKEVYLQQPLLVTYTLFFRNDVRTFDIKTLSTTDGFWTETLDVPNPPRVVQRVINGKRYSAAVVHKLLLYPTRTGKLEIGPMDIVCEVQQQTRSRSRGLFDSFFDDPFNMTNRVRKEVSSNADTVIVKPLPEIGKPDDFDGAVGEYKITATLDRDTVETNESVTYTVTISGSGNIGFLPEPKVTIPPDIERYDPEVDEKYEPVGGKLRGRKTFTYLLIPRRAGLQKIAPIRFSFFDPERGRYFTANTPELNLQVNPASGWAAANNAAPGGNPEEVRSLATDIRWIKNSARGLRRVGPPSYRRLVYPAAYAVPLAFALIAVGLRRRQEKILGDAAARRSRKAAKSAMKALKEARELHEAGRIMDGYDALARGVIHYLADRSRLKAAQLDRRLIQEMLETRKVPEDLRRELAELLDVCDTVRFTPEGTDETSLGQRIEQAKNWIMTADRYFERG